jgi:putative transposase
MLVPSSVNERWSVDFVSDQLATGRRLSISGERLGRELERLARTRPLPRTIACDHGPELTSKRMFLLLQRADVKLHFIQPDKPTQNSFVESFNGKFREYCLDLHWFTNLDNAHER